MLSTRRACFTDVYNARLADPVSTDGAALSEVFTRGSAFQIPLAHSDRMSRAQSHWRAPVLTVLCVALWIVLAAATNTGQFADNVEQFVWAQSVETAYWKHPPLPTWLLWGVIRVFGFWSGWTYVLGGLCFTGTALLTWRIADRLGGSRVAAIAVMLHGLHLGFSQRAQLYNHNTVLLLFSAATVWAVMRALESQRNRHWLLAGVFAALSILSKYQAVVMLSGILVAMALSADLRDRRTRWGCLLAIGAAGIVLSPHIAGLVWSDVSPIRYAMTRMDERPPGIVLHSLLGYAVSQLRFHLPILAAIALAAYAVRAHPPGRIAAPAGPLSKARQRAWLVGLVAWPAVATLLLPLSTGMLFQAQWGLPALQFLVLSLAFALATRLPRLSPDVVRRAVLWVQLCNGLVFLGGQFGPAPADHRVDPSYPAQQMADAVVRDWKQWTNCPLKFVAGPSFEAGFVSIHANTYPKVLEEGDFRKSPWIDRHAMERDGFVALELTAGGVRVEHSAGRGANGKELPPQLSWTVVPPVRDCAPVSPAPRGGAGSGRPQPLAGMTRP